MDFDDYRDKYENIRMSREDGILELEFHTEGDSLQWGHIGGAHQECAEAFSDLAGDRENEIVIMSGVGDRFSGPAADAGTFPHGGPRSWDVILRNGMMLTNGLLNIDALVISCVNGPALRHPEIPLLADVVLAAPEASFQDTAHFPNRTTPGDGVNFVFPLLMGHNRGRYFLLTGQSLSAREAADLGLVSEILPREELRGRARELAASLKLQNPLVRRYTRLLFTHELKKRALDLLGYGLALEGLAAVDETLLREGRDPAA